MSKHLLCVTAGLLTLFCLISSAMADDSPYLLGNYGWPEDVVVWNEADYAIGGQYSKDGKNQVKYLVWYRDRQAYRALTLDLAGEDGARYAFIPLARPDGSCGVLRGERASLDDDLRVTLYDWTEEGLTSPVEITGRAGGKPLCGDNWFALLENDSGETVLCLFDSFGRALQRVAIPRLHEATLSRCAVSADGACAAALLVEGDQCWLFAVRQNRIIWEMKYSENYGMIAVDQQGGVYVTGWIDLQADNQYTPLYLEYYSPEGHCLWKNTLDGDRVVMGTPRLRVDEASNCLVINGIAMAHSRQLYRMYRLKLDRQGSMLSLEVRDSNYHESYTLFVRSGYGADMLEGVSLGHTAMLRPFDSLPEGSDPGLKLRNIFSASGAETYVYYNPEGGRYYHADAYCPTVSEKYAPMTPIRFEDLNSPAYIPLTPCKKCGAPQRPE